MKVRWTFRPEECPSRCEKKKSIKINHCLIYGFRRFLRLFIVISDFFGFTKCDSPIFYISPCVPCTADPVWKPTFGLRPPFLEKSGKIRFPTSIFIPRAFNYARKISFFAVKRAAPSPLFAHQVEFCPKLCILDSIWKNFKKMQLFSKKLLTT